MVWDKKESWADEVDNTEKDGGLPPPPQPAAPQLDDILFPSLGVAANQAPAGGKGKKKGQKMDMRTFLAQAPGPAPGLGKFISPGRTTLSDKEILLSLPTGSRGRVEREEQAGPPPGGGMGGAFRDYGGDRGERKGRRGGGEDGGEYMPSRADEVRDWSSTRKFQPSSEADGPRGRGFGGGGFGGRGDNSRERPVSLADEAADWGGNKKFEPSTDPGAGFKDRDGPRRGGPMFEPSSKADEEEQWSRKGPPPPVEGRERSGFGFSGDPTRNPDAEGRWSRKPPSADANGSAPAPGAPTPAERPRLKLAPRTAPVESHRQLQGPGTEASASQPKKERSNPFGAAKPREEVLRENGVEADPVKEVLKYEQGEVIRDETPEEKELQKEIRQLRLDLEAFKVAGDEESDSALEALKDLDAREIALLKLKVELDDKQRYACKKESEAASASASNSAAGDEAGRDGSKAASSQEAASDAKSKSAPSIKDDKWGRKELAPGGKHEDSGRERGGFREGDKDGSRARRERDREGDRATRDGDRDARPRSSAAPGQGPAKGSGKW